MSNLTHLLQPVSIYDLPSLSDLQEVLPLWKAEWNRIAKDRRQRKQQQQQQTSLQRHHQPLNTNTLLQQALSSLASSSSSSSLLAPSSSSSSSLPSSSSSSSSHVQTHQHVVMNSVIAPSPPRSVAYSSRSSSASNSPSRSSSALHLSPSKYNKHLNTAARAPLFASSTLVSTTATITTTTSATAANIDLSQPIKLDFTPPYTLPVTSVSPKRPSKHGERMRAAAMAASSAPKVNASPSKPPVLLTSPSSAEESPSPTALNSNLTPNSSLKRKAESAATSESQLNDNHIAQVEQSSSKKPKLSDIISNAALQSVRSPAATASFLHSSIINASFHHPPPVAPASESAASSPSRKISPSRVKAGRDLFASAPRRKSHKVVGKNTPGLHNGGGIASFAVGDDSVEERQRREWMQREYESWIAKKKERERNEGITAEKMRTERLKRAEEEEEAAATGREDATMHDADFGASATHTPPPPSHTAIPQTAPSQLAIHTSLRSSGSSPSYSAQVSSAKRVKRSLFDQLNQSAASSAAPSPLRLRSPSQMPMPSPGLIAAAAAALTSSGDHSGVMQTPQKGQFTRLFQAASPVAPAQEAFPPVGHEGLLPAPAQVEKNFKSPTTTISFAGGPSQLPAAPVSASSGLMASFSQKKNPASGAPSASKPSGQKEQFGLTPKSLFFAPSKKASAPSAHVTTSTTTASTTARGGKGGLKAWLASASAIPSTTTPVPVSSGSGSTRKVASEDDEEDESDSGSEAAEQLVIV